MGVMVTSQSNDDVFYSYNNNFPLDRNHSSRTSTRTLDHPPYHLPNTLAPPFHRPNIHDSPFQRSYSVGIAHRSQSHKHINRHSHHEKGLKDNNRSSHSERSLTVRNSRIYKLNRADSNTRRSSSSSDNILDCDNSVSDNRSKSEVCLQHCSRRLTKHSSLYSEYRLMMSQENFISLPQDNTEPLPNGKGVSEPDLNTSSVSKTGSLKKKKKKSVVDDSINADESVDCLGKKTKTRKSSKTRDSSKTRSSEALHDGQTPVKKKTKKKSESFTAADDGSQNKIKKVKKKSVSDSNLADDSATPKKKRSSKKLKSTDSVDSADNSRLSLNQTTESNVHTAMDTESTGMTAQSSDNVFADSSNSTVVNPLSVSENNVNYERQNDTPKVLKSILKRGNSSAGESGAYSMSTSMDQSLTSTQAMDQSLTNSKITTEVNDSVFDENKSSVALPLGKSKKKGSQSNDGGSLKRKVKKKRKESDVDITGSELSLANQVGSTEVKKKKKKTSKSEFTVESADSLNESGITKKKSTKKKKKSTSDTEGTASEGDALTTPTIKRKSKKKSKSDAEESESAVAGDTLERKKKKKKTKKVDGELTSEGDAGDASTLERKTKKKVKKKIKSDVDATASEGEVLSDSSTLKKKKKIKKKKQDDSIAASTGDISFFDENETLKKKKIKKKSKSKENISPMDVDEEVLPSSKRRSRRKSKSDIEASASDPETTEGTIKKKKVKARRSKSTEGLNTGHDESIAEIVKKQLRKKSNRNSVSVDNLSEGDVSGGEERKPMKKKKTKKGVSEDGETTLERKKKSKKKKTDSTSLNVPDGTDSIDHSRRESNISGADSSEFGNSILCASSELVDNSGIEHSDFSTHDDSHVDAKFKSFEDSLLQDENMTPYKDLITGQTAPQEENLINVDAPGYVSTDLESFLQQQALMKEQYEQSQLPPPSPPPISPDESMEVEDGVDANGEPIWKMNGHGISSFCRELLKDTAPVVEEFKVVTPDEYDKPVPDETEFYSDTPAEMHDEAVTMDYEIKKEPTNTNGTFETNIDAYETNIDTYETNIDDIVHANIDQLNPGYKHNENDLIADVEYNNKLNAQYVHKYDDESFEQQSPFTQQPVNNTQDQWVVPELQKPGDYMVGDASFEVDKIPIVKDYNKSQRERKPKSILKSKSPERAPKEPSPEPLIEVPINDEIPEEPLSVAQHSLPMPKQVPLHEHTPSQPMPVVQQPLPVPFKVPLHEYTPDDPLPLDQKPIPLPIEQIPLPPMEYRVQLGELPPPDRPQPVDNVPENVTIYENGKVKTKKRKNSKKGDKPKIARKPSKKKEKGENVDPPTADPVGPNLENEISSISYNGTEYKMPEINEPLPLFKRQEPLPVTYDTSQTPNGTPVYINSLPDSSAIKSVDGNTPSDKRSKKPKIAEKPIKLKKTKKKGTDSDSPPETGSPDVKTKKTKKRAKSADGTKTILVPDTDVVASSPKDKQQQRLPSITGPEISPIIKTTNIDDAFDRSIEDLTIKYYKPTHNDSFYVDDADISFADDGPEVVLSHGAPESPAPPKSKLSYNRATAKSMNDLDFDLDSTTGSDQMNRSYDIDNVPIVSNIANTQIYRAKERARSSGRDANTVTRLPLRDRSLDSARKNQSLSVSCDALESRSRGRWKRRTGGAAGNRSRSNSQARVKMEYKTVVTTESVEEIVVIIPSKTATPAKREDMPEQDTTKLLEDAAQKIATETPEQVIARRLEKAVAAAQKIKSNQPKKDQEPQEPKVIPSHTRYPEVPPPSYTEAVSDKPDYIETDLDSLISSGSATEIPIKHVEKRSSSLVQSTEDLTNIINRTVVVERNIIVDNLDVHNPDLERLDVVPNYEDVAVSVTDNDKCENVQTAVIEPGVVQDDYEDFVEPAESGQDFEIYRAEMDNVYKEYATSCADELINEVIKEQVEIAETVAKAEILSERVPLQNSTREDDVYELNVEQVLEENKSHIGMLTFESQTISDSDPIYRQKSPLPMEPGVPEMTVYETTEMLHFELKTYEEVEQQPVTQSPRSMRDIDASLREIDPVAYLSRKRRSMQASANHDMDQDILDSLVSEKIHEVLQPLITETVLELTADEPANIQIDPDSILAEDPYIEKDLRNINRYYSRNKYGLGTTHTTMKHDNPEQKIQETDIDSYDVKTQPQVYSTVETYNVSPETFSTPSTVTQTTITETSVRSSCDEFENIYTGDKESKDKTKDSPDIADEDFYDKPLPDPPARSSSLPKGDDLSDSSISSDDYDDSDEDNHFIESIRIIKDQGMRDRVREQILQKERQFQESEDGQKEREELKIYHAGVYETNISQQPEIKITPPTPDNKGDISLDSSQKSFDSSVRSKSETTDEELQYNPQWSTSSFGEEEPRYYISDSSESSDSESIPTGTDEEVVYDTKEGLNTIDEASEEDADRYSPLVEDIVETDTVTNTKATQPTQDVAESAKPDDSVFTTYENRPRESELNRETDSSPIDRDRAASSLSSSTVSSSASGDTVIYRSNSEIESMRAEAWGTVPVRRDIGDIDDVIENIASDQNDRISPFMPIGRPGQSPNVDNDLLESFETHSGAYHQNGAGIDIVVNEATDNRDTASGNLGASIDDLDMLYAANKPIVHSDDECSIGDMLEQNQVEPSSGNLIDFNEEPTIVRRKTTSDSAVAASDPKTLPDTPKTEDGQRVQPPNEGAVGGVDSNTMDTLFMEKSVLETVFSSIGSVIFLILAILIFQLVDYFMTKDFI